jgi:uncharacterized protein YybS (DUF2232 family)
VIGFLKQQVQTITAAFKSNLDSAASGEGTLLFASMDADAVYSLISQLFVRNYLFSYFLVMSSSWLIADRFYARVSGRSSFNLLFFRVPESLLWPIIAAWAGVLLDSTVGIPVIGFLFWNYGMILLFLYALQGIGVLKYLFGRHGVSRLIQMLVVFSAAVVMLTPRLNLVLIVGIPLLGLSEYWVHYRAVDHTGESS